jgi:hypothetical protein
MSSMKAPQCAPSIGFRPFTRCSSEFLYSVVFSSFIWALAKHLKKFRQLERLLIAQVSTMISTNSAIDEHIMLSLITIHIAVTGENLDTRLTQGLVITSPHHFLWFVSFVSSINPEVPAESAFNVIDVAQPVYAFGLTFALRMRLMRKDCEPEIDFCERQLRRIVGTFSDRDELRSCSLCVNQSILDDDPNWCYVLYNLCQCIEHFCRVIAAKYRVPRSGTLLREDTVSEDAHNPFLVETWLPFLYNFLSLSQLRHRDLRETVQRTFCSYVRLLKIPRVFHEELTATLPWFDDAAVIRDILASAFEGLLPSFCEMAVRQTHALQAIADQFRDPGDFDADLVKLGDVFACDDAQTVVIDQLGPLFALSLFYLTATDAPIRSCAFKLVYHLLLFSVAFLDAPPAQAVAVAEVIRIRALSASFLLPVDLLHALSSHCARAFKFCALSFVRAALTILANARAGEVFLGIIAPWFTEVRWTEGLLSALVSTTYRLHLATEVSHFGRSPIDAEAIPVLGAVFAQNPVFALNFLLKEETFSKSLCVFICLHSDRETVRFLTDHLKFEFWSFEKQKYAETVNAVLDVVECLVKENPHTIAPFVHYVAVFCAIQRDLPMCKKVGELIGRPEFSEDARLELEDELMKWASSCGDIPLAIRACELLNRVTRSRDSRKCDTALDTISIIAHLLSESKVLEFDEELALVTSLLELAFLFDPGSTRLCEFVIEFVKLNTPQFERIFNATLELFDRLIVPRINDFLLSGNFVLFTLISAPLSDASTFDRIFAIILRLLRGGFRFPDQFALCFALVPYLYLAPAPERAELCALLDARVGSLTSDFDRVVLDLFSLIPSENSYLILSFFTKCALAATERYYRIVFRICRLVLDSLDRWHPLSATVFEPLVPVINGLPSYSTPEVQFISALGNLRPRPPAEPPRSVEFPRIGIPPSFAHIGFRPTRAALARTALARRIEKALAERGQSALERRKREFASVTEFAVGEDARADQDRGRRRIADFLAQRKAAAARVMVSRAQFFSPQPLDPKMFSPTRDQIDVIGQGDWPAIVW